MKSKHQQVKILLRYYSSLLEEETVETLWANVVDEAKGHYKIDNIPFYGPLLASDDIVWAEYDDVEEMLTYRETITSSGNSVIQVVILNESIEMDEIRNECKRPSNYRSESLLAAHCTGSSSSRRLMG